MNGSEYILDFSRHFSDIAYVVTRNLFVTGAQPTAVHLRRVRPGVLQAQRALGSPGGAHDQRQQRVPVRDLQPHILQPASVPRAQAHALPAEQELDL